MTMTESSAPQDELESLLRSEGAGPALLLYDEATRALVGGALDRALGGGPDRARVTALRPKRVSRVGWLAVAAVVFTGSAAAMYAAQRGQRMSAASAPVAPRAAPPRPAQPVTGSLTAPTLAEPAAAPTPARTGAGTGAGSEATVRVGGGENGRLEDLLLRANRLRGEGRYGAAERTYLRVIAESPGGGAAYSARVAAAGLRSEQLSDPRGAVRLYAQALRLSPSGPLTPEIHDGMAQAFRKLGTGPKEREALEAVLANQPEGPAAERARRRLRELDGAP